MLLYYICTILYIGLLVCMVTSMQTRMYELIRYIIYFSFSVFPFIHHFMLWSINPYLFWFFVLQVYQVKGRSLIVKTEEKSQRETFWWLQGRLFKLFFSQGCFILSKRITRSECEVAVTLFLWVLTNFLFYVHSLICYSIHCCTEMPAIILQNNNLICILKFFVVNLSLLFY